MSRNLVRLTARPIAAAGLLVVAVLLIGQFLPHFATFGNLSNILVQASLLAVAAYGMTLVVLTGGIDLSVGGVMSLVGVIEVLLTAAGIPWPVAIVLGLATGVVLGSLNAVVVARLKLPPFIATFGTLGIAAGLALFLAEAGGHAGLPPGFVSLGNGSFAGVPYLGLIAGLLLLVLEIVSRTTTWGVHLRATGDAFAVARLSGVPVSRTLFSAYIGSGVLAAAAGTLLAASLGTAGPLQGEPYTLAAVAACVIGGVDLFGGRGNLWAAAAGAVFLMSIRNILNLLGVQPFMQDFVTGCLIILAVFMTVRGPEVRDRTAAAVLRLRAGRAA
jgi:ribose transport system permease protein